MMSFVSILLAEPSCFSVKLISFIVSVLQQISVLYMAVQRHFLQYRAVLRITAKYSIRSLGLLCFRLRRIPAVPRWGICVLPRMGRSWNARRYPAVSAHLPALAAWALPICFMPASGVFRIRNAMPSAR